MKDILALAAAAVLSLAAMSALAPAADAGECHGKSLAELRTMAETNDAGAVKVLAAAQVKRVMDYVNAQPPVTTDDYKHIAFAHFRGKVVLFLGNDADCFTVIHVLKEADFEKAVNGPGKSAALDGKGSWREARRPGPINRGPDREVIEVRRVA